VTSNEAAVSVTETQTATATATATTISDNYSTGTLTETTTATATETTTGVSTGTATETTTATATETTTSDNFSTGEILFTPSHRSETALTSSIVITTAPATTSITTLEITVTAFSTITESASCAASSSTDNGLPPIYDGPTTTTSTSTSSSVSACETPAGQFLMQLDGTNLYLTGIDERNDPYGDTDQTLQTTSDELSAIAFSAATDGNGQVTFVTYYGTTLYSDQDSVVGSGDGPIYWDNYDVETNGDYYPVQFCLQPDNTFVVQNRLGTDDTSDDANVVQICPDGILYLQNAANAASQGCNTVTLRLVQLPPSYPVPTTITTSSTTSSTTTSTSTPSVSACVPVPDSQEFRVSIVGNSGYLTGAVGDSSPTSEDGSELVTTTEYSQAIPFRAAPGKDGQITLLNADGTTLYSDQDITGTGDEPIYFDTLQTSEDSGMYPVQFCLQPDNTFVVQNLATQDPADDANIVQICPDDGAVHLYTATTAAMRNCNTVRLQIASDPSAITTTSTSTSTAAGPTTTTYKEGRFRVRLTQPGTEGYVTSVGYYADGNKNGEAVPSQSTAEFRTTSDPALAVIFETVPGRSGVVLLRDANNDELYLDQDRDAGGPIYADVQSIIDQSQLIPVSLFVLLDDTIIVQSPGVDLTDPADDSSTVVICPSDGVALEMYAANAGSNMPADCTAQTLIAEFVVDATTSTSSSTSTPTASPVSQRVGCPTNTVQLPENQQFRIRSTYFPDRWVFSQTQGTTTNINDAWIFTVTAGDTGQISHFSNDDGRTYDSQFTTLLNDNDGRSVFFPNADITNQGYFPLQFCLQPDNTFNVHSVGADGPGPNDATIALSCTRLRDGNVFDNGDNVDMFAPNCFPDTYVYEPVDPASAAPPSTPPSTSTPYEPAVGCPSTTVQIPDNQRFRIKSSLRDDIWLSATDSGSVPSDGNVQTTNNVADAIGFIVTPGNTGQISLIATGNGGGRYDSQFSQYNNENSGFLYWFPNANSDGYPTQFCLQPDGRFAVRSDGTDGPGANDATIVVTCPNDPGQRVFIDNGDSGSFYTDMGCVPDTLLYDPIS
jgi:hypothetical protein